MTPAEMDAIRADLPDYVDGKLSAGRAAEVERLVAGSPELGAELAELRAARDALSGLHRMAAPQGFGNRLESTIHRRSAGRFFGRRAFGDRVPYELLALLALLLAAGVVLLLRYSPTGTVHEPLRGAPADPPEERLEKSREAIPAP